MGPNLAGHGLRLCTEMQFYGRGFVSLFLFYVKEVMQSSQIGCSILDSLHESRFEHLGTEPI